MFLRCIRFYKLKWFVVLKDGVMGKSTRVYLVKFLVLARLQVERCDLYKVKDSKGRRFYLQFRI